MLIVFAVLQLCVVISWCTLSLKALCKKTEDGKVKCITVLECCFSELDLLILKHCFSGRGEGGSRTLQTHYARIISLSCIRAFLFFLIYLALCVQ